MQALIRLQADDRFEVHPLIKKEIAPDGVRYSTRSNSRRRIDTDVATRTWQSRRRPRLPSGRSLADEEMSSVERPTPSSRKAENREDRGTTDSMSHCLLITRSGHAPTMRNLGNQALSTWTDFASIRYSTLTGHR